MGRLQKTSGKWGGGGLGISAFPNGGWERGGLEKFGVRKLLSKLKFQIFSEFIS